MAKEEQGEKIHHESTEKSTSNKTKIPRNVNYYRHLLDAKYITENDINFVLKLREFHQTSNVQYLYKLENQINLLNVTINLLNQ